MTTVRHGNRWFASAALRFIAERGSERPSLHIVVIFGLFLDDRRHLAIMQTRVDGRGKSREIMACGSGSGPIENQAIARIVDRHDRAGVSVMRSAEPRRPSLHPQDVVRSLVRRIKNPGHLGYLTRRVRGADFRFRCLLRENGC